MSIYLVGHKGYLAADEKLSFFSASIEVSGKKKQTCNYHLGNYLKEIHLSHLQLLSRQNPVRLHKSVYTTGKFLCGCFFVLLFRVNDSVFKYAMYDFMPKGLFFKLFRYTAFFDADNFSAVIYFTYTLSMVYYYWIVGF